METSYDKKFYSFNDSSKFGIKGNMLKENLKKNSFDFSKENKKFFCNQSKVSICRIKNPEKKKK